MKKAYSYQRFSSIKQKQGDSTRRQKNAAENFCQQHGLVLVDTFTDEGVSGFRGKNFSNESALSEFLKLVQNGTVERGSCLVVENMDMISSQIGQNVWKPLGVGWIGVWGGCSVEVPHKMGLDRKQKIREYQLCSRL
jgi:hypothetical protein